MKRSITLALLALIVTIAKAQDVVLDTLVKAEIIIVEEVKNEIPPQPTEPSEVVQDGSSYSFIFSWDKKRRYKSSPHWSGVGFSFLNYDNSDIPNGTLKESKSYNISLNLFDYSLSMGHPNWLFVSGVGFDFHRYHFDKNVMFAKTDGVADFYPTPQDVELKASKLVSYYVTFPIMFEYQVPARSNRFHISAGAVAFLKYYSKSQIQFRDANGRDVKENKGTDLNLRPIDIKLRAQVGIGSISAFAYYSPFSMFNNKGPEIKPYSVGVFLGF